MSGSTCRSSACASAAKARTVGAFRHGSPTRLRRLQALVRLLPPTSDFVERLGSNVRPLRPDHRATIDEEALEEVRVLERLEHRAVEPPAKVDGVFGAVIENHVDSKTAPVLCLDDAGQELHGFSSDSGSMLSSGCPAFIFSQFVS